MIETLPYDLWESRITYAEAARLANVDETVIRMWVYRSKVTRYTTAEGPRLQPIDVLRAEAATRARARRVVGR